MADVFISYAHEDAGVAKSLAIKLTERGYSVWWDYHLVGGVRFRQAILEELDRARAVLVIWSLHSVNSHFVEDEAQRAQKAGKLIPLRVHHLSIESIPLGFGGVHSPPVEDFDQIIAALQETLSGNGHGKADALRAKANAGDPDAMFHLGANVVFETDQPEFARLMKLAADKGHADATEHLAMAFEHGLGVQKDEEEARRLYKHAAELFRVASDRGDPHATHRLADLYLLGKGVIKNSREAMRLFKLAVDNGSASSLGFLAHGYRFGDGVDQDWKEAFRLFKIDVDNGSTGSMISLAQMFDKGEGVAKQPREVAELILKALRKGDKFELRSIREDPKRWSTDACRELQALLRVEGYYYGAIDGELSGDTLRALDSIYAGEKKN